MIYFQVQDVDKKFEKLCSLEANGWKELEPAIPLVKKKVIKKMKCNQPKKVASSGLRALIAAKRKAAEDAKVAENIENSLDIQETVENTGKSKEEKPAEQPKRLTIKEMIAKKREQLSKEKEDDQLGLVKKEKTFDGGFFSVKSPVRSQYGSSSKSNTPIKEKSR